MATSICSVPITCPLCETQLPAAELHAEPVPVEGSSVAGLALSLSNGDAVRAGLADHLVECPSVLLLKRLLPFRVPSPSSSTLRWRFSSVDELLDVFEVPAELRAEGRMDWIHACIERALHRGPMHMAWSDAEVTLVVWPRDENMAGAHDG